MQQTIDSIQQVGILTPVILRPDDSGGFEMISGHRRFYAAELAGLDTIPAIVRNMTDDEAIIFMVDSNLQRETILPSERAKAYKMKLDAIKRQGSRTDLTSVQVGQKLTSRERIAESSPDSPSQIRRFIRLNELDPALLKMVDDGKIGLTPAVELSFLNPQEQTMLLDTIDSEQATPSLSQAQRMKKLSGEGKLNDDTMLSIMMEQKKPETWNLTLPMDRIRKFFPRSFTPQQMENTILKLLEAWQKKRQRQNEH
jgi:ParB family chromosome partitioning protein